MPYIDDKENCSAVVKVIVEIGSWYRKRYFFFAEIIVFRAFDLNRKPSFKLFLLFAFVAINVDKAIPSRLFIVVRNELIEKIGYNDAIPDGIDR